MKEPSKLMQKLMGKDHANLLPQAMPKVAICVPSGDHVHKQFAMSLAAMTYTCGPMQGFPAVPIALVGVEGSLIVRNRNQAVEEAHKLGVDYLLFLDSDMQFPPATLRRLLGHEKDVVGATYVTREEPMRMLGKVFEGSVITTDKLNEVEALPGGCLLIKMHVFKDMVKPYFRTPAIEADGETPAWIQGEDYYFCEQARRQGFTIWLDAELSVALGHIGIRVNKIPVMQVEVPQPQEQADGQAATVH